MESQSNEPLPPGFASIYEHAGSEKPYFCLLVKADVDGPFFLLALSSLKGVSTSPVVSFSPISGRLLAYTPSTQVLVLWTPWSPQSVRVRVPGGQAVCGINPGARACSTAERNSPASFSVIVTCVCAQWALPSRGAGKRTSTHGPRQRKVGQVERGQQSGKQW